MSPGTGASCPRGQGGAGPVIIAACHGDRPVRDVQRADAMFGRDLVAAGALLALVGCVDPPAPPEGRAAPALGQQASPTVTFLPPLVQQPMIEGQFNPNLAPEVRIHRLAGG